MKRILKWAGITLAASIALVLLAAGILFVIGGSRFDGPGELRAETMTLPADSAALARGAHLVDTHFCAECHGERLEGRVLADVPPFRAVASNLTSGRGGIGSSYDVDDWERAIRHGVGPDGGGFLIMPSELYVHLSDDDLAAMIAHLRSLPPVDNELPTTEIKPLGRMIAATGGLFPTSSLVEHTAPHRASSPPIGATVEYGEYRAATMCSACHGQNMAGAQPPDPSSPPAPSLVPWGHRPVDELRTLLRTGRTPVREVNPEFMPYASTRHLTDAEIEALWLYFGTLESGSGSRGAGSGAGT